MKMILYKVATFASCLFFLGVNKANAQNIYTIAGNGTNGYSGDGGQATAAELYNPGYLAFDAAGNLYIADFGNNRIRKITTAGIISTYAGTGASTYSGDGGQATAADIHGPMGIAFDAAGNLYIADYNNSRVRKVTTTGIISTFTGNGTAGYSGDGGQATAAELRGIDGIAFDAAGNVYISDAYNNRIRMVNTAGIISTFAGNGTTGYSGDGGQATVAAIGSPNAILFDAMGNLYFSASVGRIRKVTTAGIINTYVGNGTNGYTGDGGQATAAELYYPVGLAFDATGNLYIGDQDNNRIRIVSAPCIIPPPVTLNSAAICAGTTAILTSSGANTYTWSTNATTATIAVTPTVTTSYTVTGGVGFLSSCTNTAIATITVNNATTATVSPVGCSPLFVNGYAYTASGVYTQILTNSKGCDSILTVHAGITSASTATISASGCSPLFVNGYGYTASGSYTQILTNSKGCDSTLTVHATITSASTATISTSGCSPLFVNGYGYTASGSYTQNLTNHYGCDSTLYVNVTITPKSTGTISASGCGSINVNGSVYTSSGIYTQNLTNAAGCDSTLTVNATVTQNSTGTISASGCGSINVNGYVYTSSGIYTQNLTNAKGCDSTLTIHATINMPTIATISAAGCTSVEINNTTYTTSGTYTQNLTNAVGCDSTLTIMATVNALPTLTLTATSPTVCAGSTTTLTASGATTYTWSNTSATGASISPTLTVTTQYTVTGTDANGCMNMDTLSIMVEDCTTGIEQVFNNKVTIFPNPNNGSFVVTTTENTSTILVTDILGNELVSINLNGTTTNINLSTQPSGVYFIKVIANGAQTIKRIIINN